MNFQQTFVPSETFKSTAMKELPEMETREDKFKIKQTSLTANEQAMKEYRERWTCGNHNFGRTYLGAE